MELFREAIRWERDYPYLCGFTGLGTTLVEVEGDEILEFMYKVLIFLC